MSTRLLWEGDPYRSAYWSSTSTAGESHVIPEDDTLAHEPSWRCLCTPALEWCAPGWLWMHHAFDGRTL